MFRTLYSKLAVTLVVLFVLLGVLFLAVMKSSIERQRLAHQQSLNRALAGELVAEYFVAGADAANDRKMFDAMMRINPTIELYRLDADGVIVSFSAPPGKVVRSRVDLGPVKTFLSGQLDPPLVGDDPRDRERRKIFSAAPIPATGTPLGYLYVVIGGEEYDSVMARLANEQFFWPAAWLTMSGLALGLFAGFAAFSMFTSRLERLERSISRFRDNGFDQRVPYVATSASGRADEIDRLGDAYNQMADRIIDLEGMAMQVSGEVA